MSSTSTNKKALLIVNPVSGKGHARGKTLEVIEYFTEQGYRVTVAPTSAEVPTEELVIGEVEGYDLIIAMGGDGTLNSVASGLRRSGSETPMGFLPMGSTNDFANSIGIPKGTNDACERIASAEARPLDLGSFNGRDFVYIACSGLFASTSFSTSQQLKNTLGHSAYLLKGVADLSKMKKMKLKVELENEVIEGDFLFIAISNTTRAGGIRWLNDSDVVFDDGLYELTLLKAPKKFGDSTMLVTDLLTSKADDARVIRRGVDRLKVTSSKPILWSLDGENGGETEIAEIVINKNAIRLIR